MPNTTAPPAIGRLAPIIPVISDWLNDGALQPILEATAHAASQLADGPVAVATFSPGNGYTYKVAVTRLADEAIDSWGGSHIVALPEFHRCTLLNFTGGYHVPGYIAEKMSLGAPHDGVVAAFLTLLDAVTTP